MCLIVKNEPLLEKCILSIRDHVKEIVIVDTGSTDGTIEVAKKYADIFESYSDCNDPETGLIKSFSQARQRSFDLATQDWVAWMDADDIIVGGENFDKLIKKHTEELKLRGVGFVFPYEYSYNDQGYCTCTHYRERLVYNKKNYKWVNPVHEVLINTEPNVVFYNYDDIVYKHQRQYGTKVFESGRNLRILKKYVEEIGDTDARQLYYIGLEYSNGGFLTEAIENLTKYIDVSGWDDERAMACLKLVDIYIMQADYHSGLKWAFKTIALKENWGEGYFALGKLFYFLAQKDDPSEMRNWERCVHFIKIGLDLPPTKTLLFVNPLEREYEIHRFYNLALSKLGKLKEAIESIDIALLKQKDDTNLILNRRLFEVVMSKRDIGQSLSKLVDLNEVDRHSADFIAAVINKQLSVSESTTSNQAISSIIPAPIQNIASDQIKQLDLNSPPQNIDALELESTIITLWKQYILHDEADKALAFLNNIPSVAQNFSQVINARAMTQKAIANIKNNDYEDKTDYVKITSMLTDAFCKEVLPTEKLDIRFFAGDGVEIWTPDTVKKHGIGGSETMLMEQAKRLAALGHDVRVYNSCGSDEFIFDGVQYLQTNKFHDFKCDVLVVSRRADMLLDQYNIDARLKLLWVHDVYAIRATNEALLKANKILALTNWHKANIMNVHDVHADHVLVTRNGIDLSRFNKQIPRNKFKVVNSSSPDRSWPILFDCWGRIKERVPQAELHLFYGFKNWEVSAQHDKGQADLIVRLKQQIKDLAPLGVVYHDRVSQEELANQFLSAGVWAHPTWFTETSCITAMEAQAAGLRIVTSSIAALNETVSTRGVLIDGDWTTEEYKSKFIDAVVSSMQNDDNSDRLKLQQYAKDNFGLDDLASDWNKMFHKLLEDLKTIPINPYQPTKHYKKA
jgi:glycosyltransferase involved in cell wall biosynthesis